jgi:tetratricopeptide (TPR) repeat protein
LVALANLEAAMAFDPALGSLDAEAADLALRAGDIEAASRHIDSMEASRPDVAADCRQAPAAGEPFCDAKASLRSALADRAWQAADFPTAYSHWTELAAVDLASPDQLRRRALVAAVYDVPSSRMALRDALAALPSPDPVLVDLASLAQPSKPEELAPFHAQVGGILAMAGEWRLARVALTAAVEAQPNLAIARAYLGMALERSGEDGYDQIWGAVLVDSSSSVTWTVLGTYWLDRGFPDRALPVLRHARELDPENPAPMAAIGAALVMRGDIDAAAEAYFQAATASPADPEFWSLLATLSLEWDHAVPEMGLPAARNYAALSDLSPESLDLLGYAHLLAGDPRMAIRLLRDSVEASPLEARAHYHLGLAYLDRQEPDHALDSLRTSARLDPGGRVGTLAERVIDSVAP